MSKNLYTERHELQKGELYHTKIEDRVIANNEYGYRGKYISNKLLSQQSEDIKNTLLETFNVPVILEDDKVLKFYENENDGGLIGIQILEHISNLRKNFDEEGLTPLEYQGLFRIALYSIISIFLDKENNLDNAFYKRFERFVEEISNISQEDLENRISEYADSKDIDKEHPIDIQYKKINETRKRFLNSLPKSYLLKIIEANDSAFHKISDLAKKYLYSFYYPDSKIAGKQHYEYKKVSSNLEQTIASLKNTFIQNKVLKVDDRDKFPSTLYKDIIEYIENKVTPKDLEDINSTIDEVNRHIIDPLIRKIFNLLDHEDTGEISRKYGTAFQTILNHIERLLKLKHPFYKDEREKVNHIDFGSIGLKLEQLVKPENSENINKILQELSECSTEELQSLSCEQSYTLINTIIEYDNDERTQNRSEEKIKHLQLNNNQIETLREQAIGKERYEFATILRNIYNHKSIDSINS